MKSTKWITLLCASVMMCSMSVSAAPFDAAYYAENNPDVVEQVGYDAEKLAQHYYMIGITEGRMGNAEDAAKKDRTGIVSFQDFDPEYYVQQNPDLAEYGTDAYALYRHYISYGAEEGRMPSEKAKEEADKKGQGNNQNNQDKQKEDPYARFKTTSNTEKRKKSKSKSKKEVKEELSHTISYQINDDGTHDIVCSIPDCPEGHNKTEACDIWYEQGSDNSHYVLCEICGRKDSESCDTEYEQGSDNSHYVLCEICGRKDSESCDIEYEQDSDEHHDHGDDIHYVLCKICGRKDSESCKFDYKWIDKKQHEVTCTICGYSEIYGHYPIWNSALQKRFCEGCGGECD